MSFLQALFVGVLATAVTAQRNMLLSQEGYQTIGGASENGPGPLNHLGEFGSQNQPQQSFGGAAGFAPVRGAPHPRLTMMATTEDAFGGDQHQQSFGHSHDVHHMSPQQEHSFGRPRPFRRPSDDDSFVGLTGLTTHVTRGGQGGQFEEPESGSSGQHHFGGRSHEQINHEQMNHEGPGHGHSEQSHFSEPSGSSSGFSGPSEHHHEASHYSGPGSFEDDHHQHSRFNDHQETEFVRPDQDGHIRASLSGDEGESMLQGPPGGFHGAGYQGPSHMDGPPTHFRPESSSRHEAPWIMAAPQSENGVFGLPSGSGINLGVAPLDDATIGARGRQLGIRPPRMGRAIPNEAFRKFRPVMMNLRPRGPPPGLAMSNSEPIFQSHLSPVAPPKGARLNFAPVSIAQSMQSSGGPMGGHMSHLHHGGPPSHSENVHGPPHHFLSDAPQISFGASQGPTRMNLRNVLAPHGGGDFDSLMSSSHGFSDLLNGGQGYGPSFGGSSNPWQK